MNSTQPKQINPTVEQHPVVMLKQPAPQKIQPPVEKSLTFGQRLADKLASKVGSWAFLIGQTTVLTAWVGFNSIPGLPHWDQSPFILLNLVFSFASAYTAPVVLMSQNRQSEEDRENANHNYQITLQAAQNLELLHEKFDAEYANKLDELTALIKQQQGANEVKVVYVPVQNMNDINHHFNRPAVGSVSHTLPKETVFVNFADDLDNIEVKINH
jgi:uncharacterized membrane protein